MLDAVDNYEPAIQSVLHPTDCSRRGDHAFAHALAFALVRQTKLTLLHVGPQRQRRVQWSRFPPVRQTLEKWGLLEAGSPQSAVEQQLKMRVKKVSVPGRRPVRATASYLTDYPADLIVMATGARRGLTRWFEPSVAEPLARIARTLTLFVPGAAHRGLIESRSGELTLHRILIPVDSSVDCREAIDLARGTAISLGKDVVDITLAHIGSDAVYWPELEDGPQWRWHRAQFPGEPVPQILEAANRLNVDLIVMPTQGQNGLRDRFRGSTTEQVLRGARCPVFAVPSR